MDSKGVILSLAFGAFLTATCLVGYGIGAAIGNVISKIRYRTNYY